MFKFLKEKLKTWLSKSKKEIERKAEKEALKIEEESEELKKKEEKAKKLKKEIKEEKEKIKKEGEKETKEAEEIKEEKEKLEKAEEKIKEPEQKIGLFSKLKKFFAYQITESDFEKIFSELEVSLLENNVALEVIEKLKSELKTLLLNKEIKKSELEDEIKQALKKSLEEIILQPEDLIKKIKEYRKENKEPYKILFFGINGVGKTTTIAKFANLCLKNKLSCVLAASDTFRAASIEQLQVHADKLGIKMIKHTYGSDSSAVAFDAIKYAQQNNIDIVLIDTAGRMHTKTDLLRQMEKISRVTKPNLKVFVAEAIAGSDAIEQAKTFNDVIGIDGSILAKSDVDEKGGTIISINYITKKPILYLGTGQNYSDLELFDKEKFIERLGL